MTTTISIAVFVNLGTLWQPKTSRPQPDSPRSLEVEMQDYLHELKEIYNLRPLHFNAWQAAYGDSC